MRAEGMHVRADLDRAFRCFRGFLRKNLPRGPFKAWRAPETLGPHELQTLTPWARSGRWFLVGMLLFPFPIPSAKLSVFLS